jgi:hypothetical protein
MEIVTILCFLTGYVIFLAVRKDTREMLAKPKLRREDFPGKDSDQ